MHRATLTLRVEPGTDALHRVVCVCHRRAVQIVALAYADDEITVTVEGHEQRSRHLGRWLGALHDVAAVRQLDAVTVTSP
jgi:acetolactate synthase regulatory subunit